MPGMTGLELRDLMAAKNPLLPDCIPHEAMATSPWGVEAMKKGAVDFLQKPV